MRANCYVALLILFWLSACDNNSLADHGQSQSTMDVKSQTKSIAFERLEKPKLSKLSAQEAFEQELNEVWVEGNGRVVRLLKDDNHGSRHQRFILRLSSGNTLLIAHNIDLAPRINTLSLGDTISYRGEYIYNQKGGILHWTHHDPSDQIRGGWLIHRNETYD